MADKSMLYSGPMVRALLGGTKTQTRRIIKPQPVVNSAGLLTWHTPRLSAQTDAAHLALHMRIGKGDRIWVRERWSSCRNSEFVKIADASMALMVDGWQQFPDGHSYPGLEEYSPGAFDRIKWRPGIHMPRWASRLTLTITEVRVQRLDDITEADAIAEGVECVEPAVGDFNGGWRFYTTPPEPGAMWSSARDSYRDLWASINGTIKSNPWVAAYTFTVARGNIDHLPATAN